VASSASKSVSGVLCSMVTGLRGFDGQFHANLRRSHG
jgi:hypothetical protein